MARVIPQQWIDVATGRLTLEATLYLNDLENGADADSPGINTVLAGVTRTEAKTDGIIAGTQVLATVNTADGGNLPAALSAQAGTIEDVAGGGFTVALNRYSTANNAVLIGPGTVTTLAVTAAIFGGTGPFTQLWAKVSGETFTINSSTALTTTFDKVLADAEIANAVYRITVTDSTLATATADVAVSAFSTPLA